MEADTKLPSALNNRQVKSLRAGRSRLWRRFEMTGVWAIGDQAVVSLGNFLTTIILARHFSPEVYGIWAVIFGLILFLNVIHASLITYPLTIKAAALDEEAMRRLVKGSLSLTVILTVPLGLALCGAAWLIGQPYLGLWGWLALFFWQLQEITRRALMARLAFRKALFSDAISYLGQAALVWMLAQSGELSPERCLGIVAATCGMAALVQAVLLGLLRAAGARPEFKNLAGAFWQTGRWVLWSNVATNFSIQVVPWSLFLIRGAGDAAGFQAVSNLLGFSHPIMLSLGNIIIPAAALARARGGLRAARRVAIVYAAQGGLLLLPYFVALALFPKQFLALFYSARSPYLELDGALRLFTLAYLFYYFSLVLKFLLNALEENRSQFIAELSSSLLLAIMIIPLVFAYGLTGGLIATGAWLCARFISNAIILRQTRA
jgi:O-antigen/teichoic acid export membrane protein